MLILYYEENVSYLVVSRELQNNLLYCLQIIY